jgi:predicted metalloprotease
MFLPPAPATVGSGEAMRHAALRAALVVAVSIGLAACGGGDNKTTAADQSTKAELDHGGQLFSQRCGGCHTLTRAGTQGAATSAADRERKDGPNLDNRKVSYDDALFAIRNGGFSGELMPANIVTGKDAEAVARFVARYAGSKAAEAPGDFGNAAVQQMHSAPPAADSAAVASASSGVNDPAFLRAAFDSAQSLWQQKFASAGLTYEPAHLVFFHSTIHTPCGTQSAETGPFYCPAGHGVYLNTDFFDALSRQYSLTSPFAAGYVTAHEVGHHVQQLLGLHGRVAAANQQDPSGQNGRSVRVELQADCYAGIWLHAVARQGQLSQADINDILTAAAVVGDDYQRNRAGAELAPETWTHGSSEQRVHWVSVGKRTGLPSDCDTFAPN